jgi:hypothetical protein
MPAVIRTLHDVTRDTSEDGKGRIIGRTIVYPETIITAVHMQDGRRTLDEEFEEIKDDSNETSFNSDGTITKVMTYTGMIAVTSFGDGVITETCYYPDGETVYYVKTTTFNDDGSITTLKTYADNSEEDND